MYNFKIGCLLLLVSESYDLIYVQTTKELVDIKFSNKLLHKNLACVSLKC